MDASQLSRPSARSRMMWDAWGDGTHPGALPAGAKTLLGAILHGKPHPIAHLDASTVELTPSRLRADDAEALRALVGAEHVGLDDASRVLHLGGKSTPDLLDRRSPGPQHAPDAVVSPADHSEVVAVLAECAERSIAVVPFGGGTSVVGGVAPNAGGFDSVIALDLVRTAALIDLDEVSLIATFGAGTTGPQAEELLRARGFTLGHYPQSFEFATIGGYAATRSSGQASRGYGRFDDLVHALRVATPAGELDLGRAPASAAGPDLRQFFLGSEGALGILTEVTVRIKPLPAATEYGAWTFPNFTAGADAFRELTQRGIRPTVLRLSDKSETRVNATMGGHLTRIGGCLAIATFEGTPADAAATLATTNAVFASHGAKSRGDAPARSWERGRFGSPTLRDTLLDVGVLAETLETAATWAQLAEVKAEVTAALTDSLTASGTKPIIMCHISHVYPAGASLYFTVVAALTTEPAAQWARAKTAASDAIIAAGGTITHHHAVGVDHKPWLRAEIGDLGVAILRAVKATVDPKGILNPGKLIP